MAKVSPCARLGIQVGESFANGSNHLCISWVSWVPWVSIEIYYHDNFVFGHIVMFLTSIFAHFCGLCTYLVREQQVAYGELNHGMLFICWHMLWS